MRYELSDHEWTAIKPMLPNKLRGGVHEKCEHWGEREPERKLFPAHVEITTPPHRPLARVPFLRAEHRSPGWGAESWRPKFLELTLSALTAPPSSPRRSPVLRPPGERTYNHIFSPPMS